MDLIKSMNSISIVDSKDNKNTTYVVLPNHNLYNLSLEWINTRAIALKKLIEYKFNEEWKNELSILEHKSKNIFENLINQLRNCNESNYLIIKTHN